MPALAQPPPAPHLNLGSLCKPDLEMLGDVSTDAASDESSETRSSVSECGEHWQDIFATSQVVCADATSANKSELIMGGGSQEEQARVKFLQKLSYHRVWLPKPRRPPSHQTLIIFDWDDTLICSSFLYSKAKGGKLTESQQKTLHSIAEASAKLLEMALSLGQTVIITNAMDGWVESSALTWLPSLVPLLQKVPVISARSRYEATHPMDVRMWKAEAFLAVRRQLDSQVITNLVSLGDSEYEMEATQIMASEFEQASLKLIKFTEKPSPEELLRQLELVSDEFERVVGAVSSMRIKLQRPQH
jgi:hypothetical protein